MRHLVSSLFSIFSLYFFQILPQPPMQNLQQLWLAPQNPKRLPDFLSKQQQKMTVEKIRIFLKTAVFQNYLNMTIRNHINTLIKIHTIGKLGF